jgi:hypothetical protein
MSALEVIQLPADQLPGDAVAVLYFEDQRPLRGPCAVLDWRLDGQLTRALLEGQLKGRAGEHVIFQNNAKLKSDWALFVGGGKWAGLGQATYAALVRHLLTISWRAGFRNLSLCLPVLEEGSASLAATVRTELDQSGFDFEACRLSMVEGLTHQSK